MSNDVSSRRLRFLEALYTILIDLLIASAIRFSASAHLTDTSGQAFREG